MHDTRSGFGGGKVILVGEHAVVHGVPAIAAGLDRGVSAVAQPAAEDLLHVRPWGRTVRPDRDGEDPLSRAFYVALESYPRRSPLRVDARVGLVPGAGLGCSAALGVAVLDAIAKALGLRRARGSIAKDAFAWERVFHGAPSGIDNAVAAVGGLIRFDRGRGASRLSSPSSLHLVVAHSGERSDTGEMVAEVARQLEGAPRQTRRLFEDIRGLVGQAAIAIERGDARTLGLCLDRNAEALGALGLNTRRVDALCRRARQAGALGAKVTGAGGGGCILALAESVDQATAIAGALGSEAFVAEVGRAA